MYSYTFHCSVRQIVEFVLRSGSIDYRYRSNKRAQRGTQIHQMLQKKHYKKALLEGFDYESEFSLKAEILYRDINFEIEGRADGIVVDGDNVHIEEIKSTTKKLQDIDEPAPMHIAQAKCYGYLFCLLNKTEKAKIYVTYCNLESLETKVFAEELSISRLKDFFYGILDKFYFWTEMSFEMAEQRNNSIRELKFPFGAFRKGQRDFSAAVYRSLFSKKKLFAQAPTGTGKTISTLFPAVKFLPEIKSSPGKIFYLTAKNITRGVAEASVKAMIDKGLKIKAVVLSAKEKTCYCEGEAICSVEFCPYALGHYDRVNNAILDIIKNHDIMNLQTILEYAKKHFICPFEFGLDIALFADIVICDYNYAYDPKAKLKRFFSDTQGDYIALVDEAHNLADRAREMFSAEISKDDFSKVIKLLGPSNTHIYKTVTKINSYFVNQLANLDYDINAIVKTQEPEELVNLLSDFMYDADFWLSEKEKNETYDSVLEVYFKAQDFLRISELYDDKFNTMLERRDNSVFIKLLCLDPSFLLGIEEKNFISSVFFSATLTPLDYFIEILGGDKNDNYMAIASPFESKNLFVAIDTSVSTTYLNRSKSYSTVADRLYEMLMAKEGNYFAFFSSYQYMKEVSKIFSEKYSDIKVLLQSQNMTEEEKMEFINSFCENTNQTKLGFVVLGGAFSEGIDLTGEKLIGAAVVGVGLPMVCLEKNVISDYYKKKNNLGFEYSYQYPGMNKVLQAVGRVIRTEEDKGVILLIDNRYARYEYKNLFPNHWNIINYFDGNKLTDLLKSFWDLF